jgi:PAS domain S-box-containing protein
LKRGYRSVAAFPLRVGDKVVGAFGLYSAEVNFFDSSELELLDELAGDIGFALEVDQKESERQQAERKVRSNEERFRLLIENASDIVTVINGKGVLQFVGPSVQRSLGYEPEELLHRNVFDFIDADDAPPIEAAIERLLADPSLALTFEYRFQHRNGTRRILESVGRNLADRSPEGYIVVNSRDITESRRLASPTSCARRKRWRRSASSPAASRTTSTTFSAPS